MNDESSLCQEIGNYSRDKSSFNFSPHWIWWHSWINKISREKHFWCFETYLPDDADWFPHFFMLLCFTTITNFTKNKSLKWFIQSFKSILNSVYDILMYWYTEIWIETICLLPGNNKDWVHGFQIVSNLLHSVVGPI